MINVGIVVYTGVDEIEAFAPYDILSSCKSSAQGHWTDDAAFQVTLIGDRKLPVKSSHDVSIIPQRPLVNFDNLNIVIVPGGPGARLQKYPDSLLDWLGRAQSSAKMVVSLSSAAFIFARAGMLKNRRIAVYPAFAPDIRRIEPQATVVANEPIVLDGNSFLSTNSISVSVDATLALISLFEGQDSANIASRRIGWTRKVEIVK